MDAGPADVFFFRNEYSVNDARNFRELGAVDRIQEHSSFSKDPLAKKINWKDPRSVSRSLNHSLDCLD